MTDENFPKVETVMLQFSAITKLQKLTTLGSNSEQIRHSFTFVTFYNLKRYLFYVFVFFYLFICGKSAPFESKTLHYSESTTPSANFWLPLRSSLRSLLVDDPG